MPYMYQYPYYLHFPMHSNWSFPTNYGSQQNFYGNTTQLKDYGAKPFVININAAARQNNNYRTALWTGKHLQLTLMCINPGEDIGLEMHPDVDQFLRIEQGHGLVQMGKSKDHLNYQWTVFDDSAIFVPAGTWHNVTNIGNVPLKLYSIYAPPNHPFGTVHHTKAEAIKMEEGINKGNKKYVGKTTNK